MHLVERARDLADLIGGVDADRLNLDALVGSWVNVPGFDDAIEAQDRVDEALWR